MNFDTNTFEKFEQGMLGFGAIQYDGLPDDDDPFGHSVIVGADNQVTMMAIDLGMLSPENLPTTIMGVCATVAKERAVRVGWLLSAYKIDATKEPDRPPARNFAEDDRAIEVFRCIVIEADRVSEHEAPINRSPSKVGDWAAKTPSPGPFVTFPQKALRIITEGGFQT